MDKPRLLDLYCGGGGTARGYMDAGFHVTGIDIKPQPHYCGDAFFQDDALEYLAEHGQEYDCIHASPPCQRFTRAGAQWRKAGREYPDLIGPTREALKATGRPYVIENVPGSPLLNPIMLTGAMFGLRVKRDRLFETSFKVSLFPLPNQERPIFTGRPYDARRPGPFWPVGHFSGVQAAREAMGVDWMTRDELTQAIPPAYTMWLGARLMEVVRPGMRPGVAWDGRIPLTEGLPTMREKSQGAK